MRSRGTLKGKICLVIGGTRGIGMAIVKGLYEDGNLIVLAGRSKIRALKAAKQISKQKHNLIPVVLDVTSDRQIKQAITKFINRFGKIDVLIVCAGLFKPFGPFESISFKENLEPIEVNLIGTMRCVYYTIQYMKKQKFGRIILFSGGGIGGDMPLVNAASYFTSKGSIAVFAEVLAPELAPFNVTINAVLPGQILTDSTRTMFNLSEEQLGPILSKATKTLKETGGNSTEQIVNLVKFLISQKADNVSGRLLSAKWDRVERITQKLSDEKYKLRRIEGRLYKRTERN